MSEAPEKLAYTLKEAQAAIGYKPTAFFALVKAGEIKTFGVGPRKKLVRADELQDFIDRHSGHVAP